MTRRRLKLNPVDHAVHYRTRRWSAILVIAKTLRWLAARKDRSVRRAGAVPFVPSPPPAQPWLTAVVRPGQGSFQTRGLGR